MRAPVASPYYTLAEASDLLRLSLSTIKRRLSKGVYTRVVLPAPKGAKRHQVRLLRSEIDPAVKRRRVA